MIKRHISKSACTRNTVNTYTKHMFHSWPATSKNVQNMFEKHIKNQSKIIKQLFKKPSQNSATKKYSKIFAKCPFQGVPGTSKSSPNPLSDPLGSLSGTI